jgi:hypothetical protein
LRVTAQKQRKENEEKREGINEEVACRCDILDKNTQRGELKVEAGIQHFGRASVHIQDDERRTSRF